jgi:ATP-dependent RNA/DNA helicase IGHMBP2
MSKSVVEHLKNLVNIEFEEQKKRFQSSETNDIKSLKNQGLILHPIQVTRKRFGFADYPEIEFKLLYNQDSSQFKSGVSIECFIEGEDSIKGVLLFVNGNQGEFRLFTSDFPDWLDEKGVGLKLVPDDKTKNIMLEGLDFLSTNKKYTSLLQNIYADQRIGEKIVLNHSFQFANVNLNDSQKFAVQAMLEEQEVVVVHGPPGTGKTTTLVEGIFQLVKQGKRVAVTAPTNTAVDHIASELINVGVDLLRVGNTVKMDENVYRKSLEGRMVNSSIAKEIKKLKIKAEELRKMAHQYKRHFGKAEREQRNLLLNEVKSYRKQIRDIQNYEEEKLLESITVIVGTPVGLYEFQRKNELFDILIIDEAGQLIEPLAWTIFPLAERIVLAGDPFQLPPTILSKEAEKQGLGISILERIYPLCESVFLLDVQYRMPPEVIAFSNSYFYQNKVQSHKKSSVDSICFYDTAGTGFEEESGEDGGSLMNSGEVQLVESILKQIQTTKDIVIITPYSGQVKLLSELIDLNVKISTIDSYQGQEADVLILSLVRSNDANEIGFLKDYRRMNVALTRAKKQLFVIGDSATLSNDSFYQQFFDYIEKIGGYRSAWELMSFE